jgi:transcriptional regulator with XRE-family HTH domain
MMGAVNELGEFLRARRAALDPPEHASRRRVPGLRREELAQLAGISVDYYTRMEQGRAANASDSILDALAQALGLDGAERTHLYRLARPTRVESPSEEVRPALRWLLDALHGVPAMVLGRRLDVLAWNPLAAALVTDFREQPNMVRYMFTDPAARELFPGWTDCARENVGYLRADYGVHPDDPALLALVEEMSEVSPLFRALWAEHPVRERGPMFKRMNHPQLGPLELAAEPLTSNAGQVLVTYVAAPGSPSEEALRLLASLSVT